MACVSDLRNFDINLPGTTTPQALYWSRFHNSLSSNILPDILNRVYHVNPSSPHGPTICRPNVQTTLDTSIRPPNNRHNPPVLASSLPHRRLPLSPRNQNHRSNGSKKSRSLPCCRNTPRIRNVPWKTTWRGCMGTRCNSIN